MLGGDNISGATLTRFYAIHAMLLPALLVALIAFHIYLVRARSRGGIRRRAVVTPEVLRGIQLTRKRQLRSLGVPRDDIRRDTSSAEKLYRFFPEHLWRSSIVFVAVFLILLGLSLWAHVPREPVAGTLVDSYLPRPEWYYMWLFQLLTLFPGKWNAVGSLVIPLIGVALLFLLPFLGTRTSRIGVRNRPLPLAIGMTRHRRHRLSHLHGIRGAKPYGQTILVPDRQLTASEQRGLYLYADRQCAYCHQIDGQGGHRVGPDLVE